MAKKIPKFSYTGQCSTGSDDTYWYIFLTTSGTLTFEYAKAGVDVGCVGGGGSSACIRQAGNPAGGSGGGGGYLASGKAAIEARKGYAVTIGAGGAAPAAFAAGNDGGTTSALGVSAAGGKGAGKMGWKDSGTPGAGTGAGGRGGSEVSASPTEGGDGGYVLGFGPYGGGGGGGGGSWIGGAKGGAGGGGNGGTGGTDGVDGGYGHPGQVSTGGGAGGPGGGYEEGTMGGEAAAGGSGIVILRGTQDDLLPVFFNGVQLSEIWLNGVKAGGLIRDGVRVFMRAIRRFDAERRDDRNRRKGGGMHAELPA